ncbi:MAG: hypothetical protein M1826_003899 [Phylliscum demangeonii]|nr:MAG: hypothetical protein M1826_003899 [Phylliscum demangeonii]
MAGPSKKKVAKKAAPKKTPAKKATTAKKALASADKPKATTTTTQALATTEDEAKPMAHQLENVRADFHYAVETQGDGDCMYHAISDQLYGHQHAHAEIRATTAAFLRQHRALYRPFVPVNSWDEENEGSTPSGTTGWDIPPIPTEADQDQAFESYVEQLVAPPGMWGGDLELQALAGAFLVDIVIYEDYEDNEVPRRQEPLDGVLPAGHRPEDRKLLRVAYYGGVHYASVRPLPAPAPASAKRKRTTPDRDPEEEARPQKKPSPSPSSPPSPSPPSPPPERPTPPSKSRSASCPPPSKGRPTATARAKQRPATHPASPAILTIPAPALAPAVPAAAGATANADTSPAVPAPAADDADDNNKWRQVRVRLAGVPGGEDIVISGLVRGHLTFTRAGEVLASYAVEEEEG